MEKQGIGKGGLAALIGICAAVLIGLVGLSIFFIVSLVQDVVTYERMTFQSGEILHVENGGRQRIYFEDSRPVGIPHNDFMFTNVATGEVFFSTAHSGRWSSTYSFPGVYGSFIAYVYLDEGRYFVEFEPHPSAAFGQFAWNVDIAGMVTDIFGFVVHIIWISFAFLAVAGVMVVLIIKMVKVSRQEKRSF